jgi:phosphonate transport system permease protein
MTRRIHPAIPDGAAIAVERARYPEAFRRAGVGQWLLVSAVLAYLLYLMWLFNLGRVFTDLPRVWVILRLMVDWSHFAHWDHAALWRSMVETIAMAYLGTMLAVVFAVPLGFLGARNVLVNALAHFSIRRLFDGFRGVDQLIWALAFVRAVGLGPLAGLLAIIAAEICVLAKLFAEAIENADPRQKEAVEAAGGSRLLAIRFGLLPQVLPVLLAQVLYAFESNTRSAAILGVVGAGGIGLQIAERIKVRYWDEVSFIIILILVTVAVIDQVSARVRRRLIG